MKRVSSWSFITLVLVAMGCARNDDARHDDLRRDLELASANLHKEARFPLVETLPPAAPVTMRPAPPASGSSSAQRPQPVNTPAQAPARAPQAAPPAEIPTPVSTPSQAEVADALPAIPRPTPAPIPAAEPAGGTRGSGVSGPTVVIGGGTVVIRGGAVGIDDCAAHDARRGGIYRAPPGGIAINSRFPPPVPGLPRPQN